MDHLDQEDAFYEVIHDHHMRGCNLIRCECSPGFVQDLVNAIEKSNKPQTED